MRFQNVVKRTIDIVCSGLGLIVLSPILLITAVLIRIKLGSPIFFTQDRLGKDGKVFKMIKFRTMLDAVDKWGEPLPDEERMTPFGQLLRSTSIDELPELINVFKGDMSLVGPRPERKTIMEEYEKELPEFYYRLKVKAGLTGYAQVYGKYNTTPYDKLKLDLFYIENYSFLLDIKLIFMTVKIFFQKEVSEGVDDRQINALKTSGAEKISDTAEIPELMKDPDSRGEKQYE